MSEEKAYIGPRANVADELEKCKSWCICTLTGVPADRCQIENCDGFTLTVEDLQHKFPDIAELILKHQSKCRNIESKAVSVEQQKEAHLRELMEWEKKELSACRSQLYDLFWNREHFDGKEDFVCAFMGRSNGKFLDLDSVTKSKEQPFKATRPQLGCTATNAMDENGIVCYCCGDKEESIGQLAGVANLDWYSCYGLDAPVIELTDGMNGHSLVVPDATLLLPIMPNWEYGLANAPFYFQHKLHNPTGIVFKDVYCGLQAIAKSRLDDPMMNACLLCVHDRVSDSVLEEAEGFTFNRPKNGSSIWEVKTAAPEPSRIERWVDIPFWRSSAPLDLKVFVSEEEDAFIEVGWENQKE